MEGIGMSSIRKSASFRSRIPVRRAKAAHQRRCHSPPASGLMNSASVSAITRHPQPTKKKKVKGSHKSSVKKCRDRRFPTTTSSSSSSSSYSSSDESVNSQDMHPNNLIGNKPFPSSHLQHQHHRPRQVVVSTDALSLDGLLDSVSSCGSFSSPPLTPIKAIRATKTYFGDTILRSRTALLEQQNEQKQAETIISASYESLEKFYKSNLETLRISDNGHHYQLDRPQTAAAAEEEEEATEPDEDPQLPRRNGGMLAEESVYETLDEAVNSEKQRQLSDWYYIKTSPKPRQWNNGEWRNKNGKVDYLEQYPLKSSSTSHFPPPPTEPPTGCGGRLRDPRRLPHPPEIDVQSSRMYQNLVLNRVHSLPRQEDNCTPSTSATIKHSLEEMLDTPSNLFVNSTFIQSESNLKDFHFYENLIEQKKNRLPPPAFAPQSPVSINIVGTTLPDASSPKYYPGKDAQGHQPYHSSEGDLSGSYVSLECPPPPGPAKLSDLRRDPQTRLGNFLKNFYIEFALKESDIPAWAPPISPGALCPARLELELRLHGPSHHGCNDILTVDHLLTTFQPRESSFMEAPRRVLIDCPPWVPRTALAFRILYAWAKEQPWPARGTPVALAVYVPLHEIKGTISNYLSKELLPKGSANPFAGGFGGFNAAWNSLENLKGKLLFVLDGYDTTHRLQRVAAATNAGGTASAADNLIESSKRKGKYLPADIKDLLEGRLFPSARIIVISSIASCPELLPLMQRHVTLEGLAWGRSASLLGGGQWGAPHRLLDVVQNCKHLRNTVRTPLGCLAVASIYESLGSSVPTEEIEIVEAIVNCVCSSSRAIEMSHLPELGRLALFTLKTRRSAVTAAEIKMYCSVPESPLLNCLEKTPLFGRTIRRKGHALYTMMCPGISEYLAAVYLTSLARNRPGLLGAEIAGLMIAESGGFDPVILKILQFSLKLLGNSGHVLISRLAPLWLGPNTIFSLGLAGNDNDSNLNSLSDLLGVSRSAPLSPLETQPLWIQIRSSMNELRGWSRVLRSRNCVLRHLEVHYQSEKNLAHESRNVFDQFLDALVCNESVTALRISSLIECDAKETEISYLANCVTKALQKPKLESFELILTLLEEDPPALKLQSVITALCRSVPRQTRLTAINLDLGLCTSQLVQICGMLQNCPHITRVSLPHLRCDRGAVSALANLLRKQSISSLALSSCWGARDDPPSSSSGVSMRSGSASGSSTGTSCILKQSSLNCGPSPRSFSSGLFSSLPRGVFAPTSSMSRSATLPRPPPPLDGQLPDKRSTDSVISKTWYPAPACEGGPHTSGSLHELLLAAREPNSRLHGLDFSKAQLSLEDSMCLGETVRLSPTLHSLRLEGTTRLSEVLPVIIGASESHSLQMLSVGSPRLILEDGAVAMVARSLTDCINLRLLGIDGWTMRLDNFETLDSVRSFLSYSTVRELCLSNCRLHVPMVRYEASPRMTYESKSVVVVRSASAQIIFSDNVIIRGPQLIPYLSGFPCLRELDLSAPTRSSLGTSTATSPLILDDKSVTEFFQSLHNFFPLLNTLKMCNWIVHLEDPAKAFKTISKAIRGSPLSHIKVDLISVVDKAKKQRIESQLIATLISSLPSLRWLGLSLLGMTEAQILTVGTALLDLKSNEIDLRLSDATTENAKLMSQPICLEGKFDIRVSSTFGTPAGILLHAEKNPGNKSLSRRRKD